MNPERVSIERCLLPRIIIRNCLLFFLFAITSHVFSQDNQVRSVHVKFKEKYKPAAKADKSARVGIDRVDKVTEKHSAISFQRIFPNSGKYERAHRAYGLDLWYEVKFKNDARVADILRDFKSLDYFQEVEESRDYYSTSMPNLPGGSNDPMLPTQWHFRNTGQTGGTPNADINLIKAWTIETGSPNVVVAVIDGGIDLSHPDLRNSLWRNDKEIRGNGIDDDNNGYVDDIHGYGFGDNSPVIYPDAHGSHVAGIIGAQNNNELGVSSIAGGDGTGNGVRLMSCAAFGGFRTGGFEAAMVYAADNGAVISQNSWGGGSSAIEAAIDYFVARAGYDNSDANFHLNIQTGPMAGGIVVFAAGNSNTSDRNVGYPASYPKAIAVASTDHNDVKSFFSNFGSWVDISAPGSNIFSTVNSQYDFLSGTSMACPQVSGVAALIISNLQAQGLMPSEVWNRLRLSSRSISEKNLAYSDDLGWGRLDAFLALSEPDEIPPANITDLVVNSKRSTSVILKWTATGADANVGTAAEYDLRYATSPIDESNFNTAIRVSNAPVPPAAGEEVLFQAQGLTPGTEYYFAVKSQDVFRNVSAISNVVVVKTLLPAIPQLLSTQVSADLFTGFTAQKEILVKNIGEDILEMRLGIPDVMLAPVIPDISSKGRLFAINIAMNSIEELDPKNGHVIRAIPLPEPSSKTKEGLAFDGEYLYYGRNQNIYKIDASTGEVIRKIYVSIASTISGLAWSGRYLYVSRYHNGSRDILEVDSDNGNVIKKIPGYSELTFFGNHNRLLRIDNQTLAEVDLTNGATVRTMNLGGTPVGLAYSQVNNLIYVSDGFAKQIKAVRPSDGEVMYSFPYYTTTALAADEPHLSWVHVNEKTFTIGADETLALPINIVSHGLGTGSWSGSVAVIPVNLQQTSMPVNVTLNVAAATDIETARQIDFGERYVGIPIDTTIVIANRGVSDLTITQVQVNDDRVEVSFANQILMPGQKADLAVKVKSNATGTVNGLLTIVSNDPDEQSLVIPVKATILNSPAIELSPDSIKVIVASGDTTSVTFAAKNTGQSNLYWKLNLAGASATTPTSLSFETDFSVRSDTVHQLDAGDIEIKASSPSQLKCIAYDAASGFIYGSSVDNNFYRYDVVEDKWTLTGVSPEGVGGQPASLNGKIYNGGTHLHVYSIGTNSWTSFALPAAGSADAITTDGKFIYVTVAKTFHRFEPNSATWSTLAPIVGSLYISGAGALNYHSGVIYASTTQQIYGSGDTGFQKYFINSNSWISSDPISGKASTGGAIEPEAGRYFVVGSPKADPTAKIQMSILDIREGTWSRLAMPFPVSDISSLVYVNKNGYNGVYYIEGPNGKRFARYVTSPPAGNDLVTVKPGRGTLAPGDSQVFKVALNTKGFFEGTYDIDLGVFSSNPPIEARLPLQLTVTGTAQAAFSRTSFDVGNVIIGHSLGASLIIRNKGTGDLVIDSVSVDDSFTITKESFVVPVGESVRLVTYFYPTSPGPATGTFTFHSNDPHGDFNFKLHGTGVFPAQLDVPLDTIKVQLLTGEKFVHHLPIGNVGLGSTQYLILQTDFVTGWIKIPDQGYPQNIDPQQTRTFEITIDARGFSAGIYDGKIRVEDYRDPTHQSFVIPVRMVVNDAPDIRTSRSMLNFGEQFIDHVYDSVIEIRNEGSLPLSITSVTSSNAAFSVWNLPGMFTLNPDESVAAVIRFEAKSVGAKLATITLASNDPDQPVFTIEVAASGVTPPVIQTSLPSITADVFAGEAVTKVLNLDNSGGSELRWIASNAQSSGGRFSTRGTTSMAYTALVVDPVSGTLYAQDQWYRDLLRYNPQANSWTDMGHLGAVRGHGGAVILNSKMYSIYRDDSTSIYVYDMLLKDRTTRPNKLGGSSSTVTTDGTLLYLAGGGNFKSYNPKTDQWTNLSLPNFRLDGQGGLNYYNGYVYAHSAGNNGFARYVIATDTWETLVPLPDKAILGSCIDPVRNRYYAYGKNVYSYLYEYDIKANHWTVHYLQLFNLGDAGGMAYLTTSGYQGVYFLQGGTSKGFGRFEPREQLEWLRPSPLLGEVEASAHQNVAINFNAFDLVPNVYSTSIQISSNDPLHSLVQIPVTLTVKDPSPVIDMPSEMVATVSRTTPHQVVVPIKNAGARASLDWYVAGTLPGSLSLNKALGNVNINNSDTLIITFTPAMFPGTTLDHNLEIKSNDPNKPTSSLRVRLTLQNVSPQLIKFVSDENLKLDPVQFHLHDYFVDPDGDPLHFTASSSDPSVVTVNIESDNLILTPVANGTARIDVTASDNYGGTAAMVIDVTRTVTATEGDQDSDFTISPNPFDSYIVVKFSGSAQKTYVVLYDLTGRVVLRSNEFIMTNKHELRIMADHLSPGVYNCTVFSRSKRMTSKRIIKK